jgi:hypothetical protein
VIDKTAELQSHGFCFANIANQWLIWGCRQSQQCCNCFHFLILFLCLENREYGRRDPSRWPRGTLYPEKLAIPSTTSGDRSVGIVRSRTQTMEFILFLYISPNKS